MDKKYRICKLDGCEIWRIEHLARVRWPFSWFVAPKWLPLYEYGLFLDFAKPVERESHIAAVVAVERFERNDREANARKLGFWDCGM